jgi:hypothetical protein
MKLVIKLPTKIISMIALLALINSCATKQRNPMIVIDNDLAPRKSAEQLDLNEWRGGVGLHSYGGDGRDDQIYWYNIYKKKSWVLNNWGQSDANYSRGGIDYLIYNKKDRKAKDYDLQVVGHTKLGYKNGLLVYVETYMQKAPAYYKGPICILPKKTKLFGD